MASYFLGPSQDFCHVAMVEPPVSYLESTVPAAACEIAVSIRTASCVVLLVERYLFVHRLPPTLSPPDYHRYSKKKATTDELDARATTNNYQREAHREEDSRRDGNKH